MTYANARYYNQDIGRWISQDPLAVQAPEQLLVAPQKLNMYSYVSNNPLKYLDPLGLDSYEFNNGNIVSTSRGVSDGTEIAYYEQNDIDLLSSNANFAKGLSTIDFANKVKTGGDWDYKNSQDVLEKGREYYFFNGELVSPESFGNQHYGYTGSSAGFSRDVLVDGAGFAQLYSGNEAFNPLANYDDPRDTANINSGINYYQDNNKSTFNLGRSIINTTYSNPFVKAASKLVSTSWYLANKTTKLLSN